MRCRRHSQSSRGSCRGRGVVLLLLGDGGEGVELLLCRVLVALGVVDPLGDDGLGRLRCRGRLVAGEAPLAFLDRLAGLGLLTPNYRNSVKSWTGHRVGCRRGGRWSCPRTQRPSTGSCCAGHARTSPRYAAAGPSRPTPTGTTTPPTHSGCRPTRAPTRRPAPPGCTSSRPRRQAGGTAWPAAASQRRPASRCAAARGRPPSGSDSAARAAPRAAVGTPRAGRNCTPKER